MLRVSTWYKTPYKNSWLGALRSSSPTACLPSRLLIRFQCCRKGPLWKVEVTSNFWQQRMDCSNS